MQRHLLPALAWRVGPSLTYGLHAAAMAYGRSATDAGGEGRFRPTIGDWQRRLKPLVFLIRGELAKTPLLRIVELHKIYNFALESFL